MYLHESTSDLDSLYVTMSEHYSIIHDFFVSDINELSLPKTCQVEFPDPDDLLSFKLNICPDEVRYRDCWSK